MHPTIKISLRIGIIFALIFFASKPYNFFCNLTNKCQPFYFSYLIPKKEGKTPVTLNFEITNYRQGLDFRVLSDSFQTVSNRKNIVNYSAKNTSNRTIKFNTELVVEPEYLEEYITRYQCLCSQQYSLKPNEEIKLRMIFLIDEEFFKYRKLRNLEDDLKIRYVVNQIRSY
jgi:cytochrome c oxidase assembly protein Cox11